MAVPVKYGKAESLSQTGAGAGLRTVPRLPYDDPGKGGQIDTEPG